MRNPNELKWNPIETAPMDGTDVLLAVPRLGPGARSVVLLGYYVDEEDEWFHAGHEQFGPLYAPTHWMPLPAAPQEEPPPTPSCSELLDCLAWTASNIDCLSLGCVCCKDKRRRLAKRMQQRSSVL